MDHPEFVRLVRRGRPIWELDLPFAEMRQTGYATFAARQFRPYLHAAVDQFSPKRRTLTERVIDKFRHVQSPANRSR